MLEGCGLKIGPYNLTHGSLFSGIGGFDLGFQRAGIETRFQVENDSFCRGLLEQRFPDARRISDIRDVYRFSHEYPPCECCGEEPWCERHGMHFGECACIGCSQWDDEIGPVDIISGGDPCQENSNARRAGENRSPSLGAEFLRVVELLRPRIVVRENPTAVRADAPWPWWRFRAELERLGYGVLPFRFRACCAGADFRRDRLFLLGELQKPECERLEGNEREIMARAEAGRHDANTSRPNRWSSTPRICRRADGIPHRMDRLKSLGNSVVPAIAQWIGERIRLVDMQPSLFQKLPEQLSIK
jgi:DNA (cytosine-5)-methyltransferase 1